MLRTLRATAIAVLIIGVLFKVQHWPGVTILLIAAWGLALMALVARPVIAKAMVPRESMRDLFTFGLMSVVVMRLLHLPGKGFALGVLVLAGIGLLWYDRDRILLGKGEAGVMPWLFYAAIALVLTGTVFRIQHWPYGTALLLGGLALAAFWFFASKDSEQKQ